MSVIIPKTLLPVTIPFVELTNAFVEYFLNDNPRSKPLQIAVMQAANKTAGVVTVSVCFMPPAGTPDSTNAVLWNFPIPANDFLEFGRGSLLDFGYSVRAKAGVNSTVNFKMSGTYDYSQ